VQDTNAKIAYNVIHCTSVQENPNVKNDRWHFCK